MRFSSSHLLLSLGILFGVGLVLPARADVALGAKTVSLPGLKMQEVQALVGEDGQGGLKLSLRAAKADVPTMGWRRVNARSAGHIAA